MVASVAGVSVSGITVRANFLTIDSMNGRGYAGLLLQAHDIEVTVKSHFKPHFGRLTIGGFSLNVAYPNQTGV